MIDDKKIRRKMENFSTHVTTAYKLKQSLLRENQLRQIQASFSSFRLILSIYARLPTGRPKKASQILGNRRVTWFENMWYCGC